MVPVHGGYSGTEISLGQTGQPSISDDDGLQPDALLRHNEMPSENADSRRVMGLSRSCQRPINTSKSGDVDIGARGGNDRTQLHTSSAPGARSTCVTGNREPSAGFSIHFPVNVLQPGAAE